MSSTKLIPSRPLLRYLSAQLWSASKARSFCLEAQQLSTSSLRRTVPSLPSQQCRNIFLARIVEKARKQKLQADNHKILGYDSLALSEREYLKSQKIILWREAYTRPLSRPHVFIGVLSVAETMKKYLVDRHFAVLDPGIDTSWMLVPRIGYEMKKAKEFSGAEKVYEQIVELEEKTLDEYLLVKRKPWMVPKPSIDPGGKGGRGGAKILHLSELMDGKTVASIIAKAYYFLKLGFLVEFHVSFTKKGRYTKLEMYEKLLGMPGGLACHPSVVQRQLPANCAITIQPVSNGRELVWIVDNWKKLEKNVDWVDVAKEKLAELGGTPEFVMKKGRELAKDRVVRLRQDKEDIASLQEEGKPFDHILEKQREISQHEADLREMFGKRNRERRHKKMASDARRLANRLAYKEHKLRMAAHLEASIEGEGTLLPSSRRNGRPNQKTFRFAHERLDEGVVASPSLGDVGTAKQDAPVMASAVDGFKLPHLNIKYVPSESQLPSTFKEIVGDGGANSSPVGPVVQPDWKAEQKPQWLVKSEKRHLEKKGVLLAGR